MDNGRLIVRYPRAGPVIGAALFGGACYGFLDFQFLHHIAFDIPPAAKPSLLFWFGLLAATWCFLVCAKTAVFPSLLFSADQNGVKIGRGIFRNVVLDFSWVQVVDIRSATIAHMMSAGLSTTVPAIEIVFDTSVVLPTFGDEMACASGRSSYVIAHSLIRLPIDATVARLRKLKDDSAPRRAVSSR
jgi:hypothetical protein